MCGIGFLKRLEDDSGRLGPAILPGQIDLLVNSLEYRGNDAAGVALVSSSGAVRVYKDHEPAWTVTAQQKYKDFLEEFLQDDILTALVHTRKATKGSPYRNDNNHPMYKGAGVVVHNGMIHNDDALFHELKLDRGAETDSDILRAILDAHNGVNKKSLQALNRVGGSVASALCHPADPTKLMLLRSGNPLVIASDGQGMLFGASDKRAIYRAARPWVMRNGFPMQLLQPQLAFLTMPNDTGYIIGAKGLEWHDKFSSSAVRYRYSAYSDVYSPHTRPARREAQERVATREETLPRLPERVTIIDGERRQPPSYLNVSYVKCPKEGCECIMAMSKEDNTKPLSRFRCPTCKTNLEGATKSMRSIQKAAN